MSTRKNRLEVVSEEVVEMNDKTVLITGGTGGIGKQTALALAKMGAQVMVSGRSQAGGETAVTELKQLSGNPNIGLLLGDLATQTGVHSLAAQFQQEYGRLDVLINNAGLAATERRLTEDGIEADFAVNVVAPFFAHPSFMGQPAGRPGWARGECDRWCSPGQSGPEQPASGACFCRLEYLLSCQVSDDGRDA